MTHIPATDDLFFEISRKHRYNYRTMLIRTAEDGVSIQKQIDLLEGNYPKDLSFPLTFCEDDILKGKRMRDFLCSVVGKPLLISAAFKDKLEAHKVTGWKSYPIVLLDRKGREITSPQYFGFSITGRCGRRNMFQPDGVTYHTQGIQLDPATWDGCDIFIEVGYRWGGSFISRRVVELFLSQDELEVIPISQVPVYTILYDFDRGIR